MTSILVTGVQFKAIPDYLGEDAVTALIKFREEVGAWCSLVGAAGNIHLQWDINYNHSMSPRCSRKTITGLVKI